MNARQSTGLELCLDMLSLGSSLAAVDWQTHLSALGIFACLFSVGSTLDFFPLGLLAGMAAFWVLCLSIVRAHESASDRPARHATETMRRGTVLLFKIVISYFAFLCISPALFAFILIAGITPTKLFGMLPWLLPLPLIFLADYALDADFMGTLQSMGQAFWRTRPFMLVALALLYLAVRLCSAMADVFFGQDAPLAVMLVALGSGTATLYCIFALQAWRHVLARIEPPQQA